MYRPELAPKEARVCDGEEGYNLSLALQRLSGHESQNLSGEVATNHIRLDEEGRVAILTGPNRGGKTTFAQAVGLIQVLTQAGLYVPGSRARISPVDGVYTHFPVEEELARSYGIGYELLVEMLEERGAP
jgi:DNA mismatch repair ATPase MutS